MSRKGKSSISSMNEEDALAFASEEGKGDDLQEIKKELVKIEEKVDALLASLEQMESDPSEQCEPYVRSRPEEEMESNAGLQETEANMEMEETGGGGGGDGAAGAAGASGSNRA
ncbi:heterogeneous nuclear ribonucleoproteins C1/C2-like [Monodelphis domestica]|uniref:heterogeneous nuclear ribonucleoproteins C1/C2-like n=1 Tax=Monodelphis domestica TaxID=13616 RepID=UPI0024E1E305|nr:heterogeneous nuclear ribonucleoproteins C1/C2-like [Monodelphis domestica]